MVSSNLAHSHVSELHFDAFALAAAVGSGEKTVMNDSSGGSTAAQEEGPHTPQEMVICRPSLPAALMNAAAAVENDDSEELSPWETVPVQETGPRYPEELV